MQYIYNLPFIFNTSAVIDKLSFQIRNKTLSRGVWIGGPKVVSIAEIFLVYFSYRQETTSYGRQKKTNKKQKKQQKNKRTKHNLLRIISSIQIFFLSYASNFSVPLNERKINKKFSYLQCSCLTVCSIRKKNCISILVF